VRTRTRARSHAHLGNTLGQLFSRSGTEGENENLLKRDILRGARTKKMFLNSFFLKIRNKCENDTLHCVEFDGFQYRRRRVSQSKCVFERL
jgi:hypothetical protein